MNERVAVVGVGMVPFATPSKSQTFDVLAEGAVTAALTDAGIRLPQVQQVYAGYVNSDSASGQNTLYRVGMTGVLMVNVEALIAALSAQVPCRARLQVCTLSSNRPP